MLDLRKSVINDVVSINGWLSVLMIVVYVVLITIVSVANTSWWAIAFQVAIAISFCIEAKAKSADHQRAWSFVLWAIAALYGATALVCILDKAFA